MKKMALIAVSLIAALSFASCSSYGGSTKKSTSNAVSVVKSESDINSQLEASRDISKDDSSYKKPDKGEEAESGKHEKLDLSSEKSQEELKMLFKDIADNYYPGTAGCSLSAAKKAAAILDLQCRESLSSDDIYYAAKDYYSGLKDKDEFKRKIDDIYGLAYEMGQGKNGADILDCAGYKSDYFPWGKEKTDLVFTAIYKSMGMELPLNN